VLADRRLDDALDAARRGDETGLADLWRTLNPLLLRYLRVFIKEGYEDVASEAWLLAAREIRGYRGDAAGFRVWLFRTARFRALDELRRVGRRLEDPAGLQTWRDRPAADDTAEAAQEAMATRRALALIARLPRDQAEAVLLREVIGMSAGQAADVLGKRPGAVRIAAMRGLRRLAAVVEADQAGGADRGEPAAGPDRAAMAAEVAE
jgi:RNA polymerase sigma-70 factor, ECF subfamily